jgi:hypothetical protein
LREVSEISLIDTGPDGMRGAEKSRATLGGRECPCSQQPQSGEASGLRVRDAGVRNDYRLLATGSASPEHACFAMGGVARPVCDPPPLWSAPIKSHSVNTSPVKSCGEPSVWRPTTDQFASGFPREESSPGQRYLTSNGRKSSPLQRACPPGNAQWIM